MAKLSQQSQKSNANNNNGVTKVKRTRRSVPRDSPPQRSSIYRGVTRHRWTGRYEAHLWDKNCWNESQNKKGRQVYLGAYDDEEAAAHAYDLAALKYWGPDTILNFPLSTYQKELKDMEGLSREEYIGSLRRKSSGFSRGVSKYRGVARHHHNGRWEARIGRVFGNKYLYLGTYATQEEAATAYDMAAIEYRGLNAVTNFDLSRYIKWLKPNHQINPHLIDTTSPSSSSIINNGNNSDYNHQESNSSFFNNNNQSGSTVRDQPPTTTLFTDHYHQPAVRPVSATSALGLLLQSSKFKEMMEMTSSSEADNHHCSSLTPSTESSDPLQCSFPEDIQTYFGGCQDSSNFGEGDDDDDVFFRELNSFVPPMFQCDFDA
ncbi:AP2-like ethylene-responsive transcription factor [Citrus sinensis]|uniref:AP2-like ethylene-responsive transcription factor n=1 Tax=Citrus sinensis TaxID=2711 RepID=A0ACB8P8C7_CITSI|nr:AP2-like ethylene-responsive transcription factor [Citrus sinensis]